MLRRPGHSGRAPAHRKGQTVADIGSHVLTAHLRRLGHHHDAAHAAALASHDAHRREPVATGATPAPGAPQRPNLGDTGGPAR